MIEVFTVCNTVCKKCLGAGKIRLRDVNGEKVVRCSKCKGTGKRSKR